MKNFLKAFLAFLLLALIATLFNYLIGDSICGHCNEQSAKVVKSETNTVTAQYAPEFVISDSEGNNILKFPGELLINANGSEVTIPENMQGLKDSIFNYLNLHQGKELLITANYLQKEGEPIGLDRANYLKKILVAFGINEARIVPKANLSTFSFDDKGNNNNGISMLFRTIPQEHQAAVEKSITQKTLYSKFAATAFEPDNTLKGYAAELSAYLKNHPDKNVSVTGHTDNVGKHDANYELGLKRAQQVVKYLISQNIEASRIKSFSKGETDPIASNDTEEGRKLNRRITIIVK